MNQYQLIWAIRDYPPSLITEYGIDDGIIDIPFNDVFKMDTFTVINTLKQWAEQYKEQNK